MWKCLRTSKIPTKSCNTRKQKKTDKENLCLYESSSVSTRSKKIKRETALNEIHNVRAKLHKPNTCCKPEAYIRKGTFCYVKPE